VPRPGRAGPQLPRAALEGAYPYLWLDATVERVREPGGVRHKALVIAYGVHESGRREVIGVDVGEAETDSFWRQSLRSLRAGGLDGVKLCSSDAHVGLKHAIALVLGCPWQRCTVHFLRDLLGHVSRAQQPLVSGAIGGIFTRDPPCRFLRRDFGVPGGVGRAEMGAREPSAGVITAPGRPMGHRWACPGGCGAGCRRPWAGWMPQAGRWRSSGERHAA
jgi:hypothetical protein